MYLCAKYSEMERKKFLKMIGVGVVGAAFVPTILKAEKRNNETIKPSVTIDIATITHLSIGGNKLTAVEIIKIWRETGILLYNSHFGNPPIVFEGEIEVIDYKNKI